MTTGVATHEAGHALVSYVLEFAGAGPVTIDARGVALAGLCLVGRAPDVESDIMCSLAGQLAEEVLNPFGRQGWAAPAVDADDVDALAAKLDAMPAHEAARLATALLYREKPPEKPSTMSGDDEHAWSLATETWPGEAVWRVPELADRTRALLTAYGDAVQVLAAELDEHGTLSRDQWHAVLAAAGVDRGEAAPTPTPTAAAA